MATKQYLSPINIDTSRLKRVPPMPPLTFEGLFDSRKFTRILNTGQTARIELCGDASVSGGPLDGKYELQGMDFHWGCKDGEGGEHTIDGKRFSFEAHLEFQRIDIIHDVTPTGDESEDELSYREVERLVAVALLFQAEPSNRTYYNMFSYLSRIVEPETVTTVDANLFREFEAYLKPDEFYTYTGSLTVPPYTEYVQWIVYKDVLPISHRQLESFRSLRSRLNFITRNWIGVKELNRRPVYYPVTDLLVCPGKMTCGCEEEGAVKEVLCCREPRKGGA